MKLAARITIIASLLFTFIFSKTTHGQEVNVQLGVRDSLNSSILNETRHLLVHLPENYDPDKSYPVLYRLDGSIGRLMEIVTITNRLTYADELAPEMIIVAVENTSRARDMWPVNNKYYPAPYKAGAADFLAFIEKELMPFVNNKYPVNQQQVICGQSLSALFVVYAFLSKPQLFDAYIASSAGFPECEAFFTKLRDQAFAQPDSYRGKRLFVADGRLDPLDPDGAIHQQLVDFSAVVEAKLAEQLEYKYVSYKDAGHVPFHSFYDGLKFVFRKEAR